MDDPKVPWTLYGMVGKVRTDEDLVHPLVTYAVPRIGEMVQAGGEWWEVVTVNHDIARFGYAGVEVVAKPWEPTP